MYIACVHIYVFKLTVHGFNTLEPYKVPQTDGKIRGTGSESFPRTLKRNVVHCISVPFQRSLKVPALVVPDLVATVVKSRFF